MSGSDFPEDDCEATEASITAMANELAAMDKEGREARLKEAKKDLEVHAAAILELQKQQLEHDLNSKALGKAIAQRLERVRNLWRPFIEGLDEAVLELEGGFALDMKNTLNVSVEAEEEAIEWLQANGFEGVMRWAIHNQTLKKIAREEYEKPQGSVQIPGLKYTKFPIIKVKKSK